MSRIRPSLLALLLVAAPAAAQVADGTNGDYVPAQGTGQLTHFGTCIVVTNKSANNVQFMFGDAASWNTFLAHPAPKVSYSPCGCGSLANGQSTQATSTNTQACPAPDTGNETQTVTQQQECEDGSIVNIGSPTTSAWNTSGCAVPTCTDSQGVQHANGSEWIGTVPTTEACFLANAGYASGTATDTIANTYYCSAGTTEIISSIYGVWNTSACRNSDGGSCPIQTQAQCSNTANYSPDPICVWSGWAWGDYVEINAGLGLPWCYTSVEYQSILVYSLGSDGCCHATAEATPCNGQPGATGYAQCGLPIIYEFPEGTSGPGFINGQVSSCAASDLLQPPYPSSTCPDGNQACTFSCTISGAPN